MVVTGTGADRAGLVVETTALIRDSACNISESRSMKMGSCFSTMMLVSGDDADVTKAIAKLKDSGLMDFQAYDSTDPMLDEETEADFAADFMLDGADSPGLVSGISAILQKHGMNIVRCESTVSDDEVPHGGTTLFQLQGTAVHPGPLAEDWTPDAIREELEDWAESVNCEVQFEDVDDMEDEDDESFGDDWDAMEMEKEFLEHAKTAEKKNLPSGGKK
jgi:glycine cleavage system regulatory protein